MDRVRESLFNLLTHRFAIDWEQSVVVDGFSGSGALGFEALSRGAKEVYLCEKDPLAWRVLEENWKKLDSPPQAHLYRQDFLQFIFPNPCHLVFLDPPYTYDTGFLFEHLKTQISKNTLIYFESSNEFLNFPLIHYQKKIGKINMYFSQLTSN